MRCFRAVSIALLLSLIPLTAATPDRLRGSLLQSEEMNFTVEGKITRRTPGRLTVNTGENIVFQVRHDDKTEIMRVDGSPGTPEDLRLGTSIRVAGNLSETGEITARKITLQSEPARDRR